jgi:hypothetical protein
MPEIKPKRPTATKEMILAAATTVADNMEADAATIAEHYQIGMDGYELAKALNKYAFLDISREDMEALDEVNYLVEDAVRKAEKTWFVDNDIQPPLPIGAQIMEGLITGVSDDCPATYLVKETGCMNDSRHRLIRFENAVNIPITILKRPLDN